MIPRAPDVRVPSFWIVRPDRVYEYLAILMAGELDVFGTSAGGRPLHAVRFPRPGAQDTFLLLAGLYGHEPGTVAAAINFLEVLRCDRDLRAKPWPQIVRAARTMNVIVVPMLNPDARQRCPDSLVGFPTPALRYYARGLTRAGQLGPAAEAHDGVNPEQMLLLGGFYDDAGLPSDRHHSPMLTSSASAKHLFAYLDRYKPTAALVLHAGYAPRFHMTRTFPEEFREKLRAAHRRAAQRIAAGGAKMGPLAGDRELASTGENDTARMLHLRYGALAAIFEGRQGLLDKLPACDHDQILDEYLVAIEEFIQEGVGGFLPRVEPS